MPLYSGGVLDSWPGQAVDAIRICREELEAVRAYLAAEEAEKRRTERPRKEVRRG